MDGLSKFKEELMKDSEFKREYEALQKEWDATQADITFELSVDPFYSESNIRYLESIVKDIQEGRAHFAEHDLIEEE